MKNKYIILFVLIFLGISCSEEKDLDILDDLASPEYKLPKGAPGSLDEKIYNIHQKYGTFVLYDFEETDFKRLWTSQWYKWYAPANKSEDLKYVSRFVDFLDENIFSSYEPEFIKKNFPYKVFLVDTLVDRGTYNKRQEANVLSNGNNAIAISNVGLKSDSWTQQDWNLMKAQVNNAFTKFYYSSMDEKPTQFISLAFSSLIIPNAPDPAGIEPIYESSCFSVGYVRGRNGTWLSPVEEDDFADFITFLTTKRGSYLEGIFGRFPLMKERSIILYNFLKNKMDMDLVATQNLNFPDDKVTTDLYSN